MNAVTSASDPPVFPFGSSRVEQARIPGEWDGNSPAVLQADTQSVFREFHVGNPLVSRQHELT